jgi:aspartyl/glutamyl-tRNA(Asn/Gln) amidotransferase subunit C (EC 6.3.5.-)
MSDTHPPLNIETVHHIANLVQLGLTDEEAAAFLPQLNAILEYFALLQEVDTESVPPAFLLPGARNVLREDHPEPGMSRGGLPEQRSSLRRGVCKRAAGCWREA